MSEDLKYGDLIVPGIAVDRAVSLLERISGPIVQSAELISDRIRAYRYSLAMDTLDRAAKKLEGSSVPVSQIPLKFLVPFLDGCSLEEDESLRDLWAGLLVSEIDKSVPERADFIDILAKMTPIEAKTFLKIAELSGVDRDVARKRGLASFSEDLSEVDSLVKELYEEVIDEENGAAIVHGYHERVEGIVKGTKNGYFLGFSAGIATNDPKISRIEEMYGGKSIDIDLVGFESLRRRDLIESGSHSVMVARFNSITCSWVCLSKFGHRFFAGVMGER